MGHIFVLPRSGMVKTPPFLGVAAPTEPVRLTMEKMIKANIAVTIFQLIFFEVIVPPFYVWVIEKSPCRWDVCPHKASPVVKQLTCLNVYQKKEKVQR